MAQALSTLAPVQQTLEILHRIHLTSYNNDYHQSTLITNSFSQNVAGCTSGGGVDYHHFLFCRRRRVIIGVNLNEKWGLSKVRGSNVEA